MATIEAGEQAGEKGKTRHDSLKVKSISVGTDDRTVILEIEGFKPAMQMAVRYGVQAADGAEMKGEVVHTVHQVGKE